MIYNLKNDSHIKIGLENVSISEHHYYFFICQKIFDSGTEGISYNNLTEYLRQEKQIKARKFIPQINRLISLKIIHKSNERLYFYTNFKYSESFEDRITLKEPKRDLRFENMLEKIRSFCVENNRDNKNDLLIDNIHDLDNNSNSKIHHKGFYTADVTNLLSFKRKHTSEALIESINNAGILNKSEKIVDGIIKKYYTLVGLDYDEDENMKKNAISDIDKEKSIVTKETESKVKVKQTDLTKEREEIINAFINSSGKRYIFFDTLQKYLRENHKKEFSLTMTTRRVILNSDNLYFINCIISDKTREFLSHCRIVSQLKLKNFVNHFKMSGDNDKFGNDFMKYNKRYKVEESYISTSAPKNDYSNIFKNNKNLFTEVEFFDFQENVSLIFGYINDPMARCFLFYNSFISIFKNEIEKKTDLNTKDAPIMKSEEKENNETDMKESFDGKDDYSEIMDLIKNYRNERNENNDVSKIKIILDVEKADKNPLSIDDLIVSDLNKNFNKIESFCANFRKNKNYNFERNSVSSDFLFERSFLDRSMRRNNSDDSEMMNDSNYNSGRTENSFIDKIRRELKNETKKEKFKISFIEVSKTERIFIVKKFIEQLTEKIIFEFPLKTFLSVFGLYMVEKTFNLFQENSNNVNKKFINLIINNLKKKMKDLPSVLLEILYSNCKFFIFEKFRGYIRKLNILNILRFKFRYFVSKIEDKTNTLGKENKEKHFLILNFKKINYFSFYEVWEDLFNQVDSISNNNNNNNNIKKRENNKKNILNLDSLTDDSLLLSNNYNSRDYDNEILCETDIETDMEKKNIRFQKYNIEIKNKERDWNLKFILFNEIEESFLCEKVNSFYNELIGNRFEKFDILKFLDSVKMNYSKEFFSLVCSKIFSHINFEIIENIKPFSLNTNKSLMERKVSNFSVLKKGNEVRGDISKSYKEKILKRNKILDFYSNLNKIYFFVYKNFINNLNEKDINNENKKIKISKENKIEIFSKFEKNTLWHLTENSKFCIYSYNNEFLKKPEIVNLDELKIKRFRIPTLIGTYNNDTTFDDKRILKSYFNKKAMLDSIDGKRKNDRTDDFLVSFKFDERFKEIRNLTLFFPLLVSLIRNREYFLFVKENKNIDTEDPFSVFPSSSLSSSNNNNNNNNNKNDKNDVRKNLKKNNFKLSKTQSNYSSKEMEKTIVPQQFSVIPSYDFLFETEIEFFKKPSILNSLALSRKMENIQSDVEENLCEVLKPILSMTLSKEDNKYKEIKKALKNYKFYNLKTHYKIIKEEKNITRKMNENKIVKLNEFVRSLVIKESKEKTEIMKSSLENISLNNYIRMKFISEKFYLRKNEKLREDDLSDKNNKYAFLNDGLNNEMLKELLNKIKNRIFGIILNNPGIDFEKIFNRFEKSIRYSSLKTILKCMVLDGEIYFIKKMVSSVEDNLMNRFVEGEVVRNYFIFDF